MFIPQIEDYLPPSMLVIGALAVGGLMVWLTVYGRTWGRNGGIALCLVALMWIPLNKPIEGPILMRLGHDKGLVLADIVAMVVLLVGLWRIAASRSERRNRQELSVTTAT